MQRALCTVALALGLVVGAAASAMAQPYPPVPAPLTISDATVFPGQTVTVSGEGAEPGATVRITFASDPVVVATTTANETGAFAASFKVPASAEPGLHTVSALSGGVVLGTVTVRVQAVTTTTTTESENRNQLAFTGLNVFLKVGIGLGMILLGAALLLVIRRRRAATSASA
jgi:hypothetical protein